jgi:hypothetical protein
MVMMTAALIRRHNVRKHDQVASQLRQLANRTTEHMLATVFKAVNSLITFRPQVNLPSIVFSSLAKTGLAPTDFDLTRRQGVRRTDNK